MANFIGLVYGTLKSKGIDTSKMSTEEAIAKFNEINKEEGSSNIKNKETKDAHKNNYEQTSKEITQPFGGDYARYNKLANMVDTDQTDKYSTQEILIELKNVGLNEEGAKAFFNLDDVYDNDMNTKEGKGKFLSAMQFLFNEPIFREGNNLSKEEVKERLQDIKTKISQLRAKNEVSPERQKAEGINVEENKAKFNRLSVLEDAYDKVLNKKIGNNS